MENEQLIESYCTEILLLKDKDSGKRKDYYKKNLQEIYGEVNPEIFDTAWKKVDETMKIEGSDECKKHTECIEKYQGNEEDRKQSVQNKLGKGFNEDTYGIALAKTHRQVISKYREEIENSFKSVSSDDELQETIQKQIEDNFDDSVFSEALSYLKRLYKNRYKEYIRSLTKSLKGTNLEDDIKSKVQKKFGNCFREDIFENAKNEIQREKTIKREAAILSRKEQPLNQILFGPPGTGKTYISIEKALDIINPLWKEESGKTDEGDLREHAITLYNRYVELGQIVFTTFHQSMSYEDFIEGIKPSVESTENTNSNSHTIVEQKSPSASDMGGDGQGEPAPTAVHEESAESKKTNNISYSVQPGIFKEICDKALLDYLCECFCQEKRKEDYRSTDDELKRQVLELYQKLTHDKKEQPEDDDIQSIFGKTSSEGPAFNIDDLAFNKEDLVSIKKIIKEYKADLQKCCYETASLQNIGDLFYKEYIALIEEEIKKNNYYELQSGRKITINNYPNSKKFAVTETNELPFTALQKELCSQREYKSYGSYLPLFVDDYKNFVRRKKTTTPYVLIIDEINRGNIASIFGELITLIEDSKRLGRLNALTAKLPYSHEEFGVPDNLYIIGTMNTADRSVEALDSALRRRFVFEEMMPDSKCVPDWEENVGDENNKIAIKLREIFDTINARLRVLKDRDHQIGHSYFMNIKDDENKWEKLKEVFYRQIIPLLQEYFFNRYDLIAKVLGDGFVKQDSNSKWGMAVCDDDDDFTDKKTWIIVPEKDFYDPESNIFRKDMFLEAITKLLGSDIYSQYKELKLKSINNTNGGTGN